MLMSIMAVAAVGAVCAVAQDHFFPQVQRADDFVPEHLKTFQGNGGNLLPVPGLKELHSVRVGGLNVPLTEIRQVLTGSDEKMPTEAQETPLVRLVTTPDGPMLQRGVCSNDGIWQMGARIDVTGIWEGSKPGKAEAKAPPAETPKTETPKTEAPSEETPQTPKVTEVKLPEHTDRASLAKALDKLNSDPLKEIAVGLDIKLGEAPTKKEMITAIVAVKFPEN